MTSPSPSPPDDLGDSLKQANDVTFAPTPTLEELDEALRHKEAIACRSIFSGVGPACMSWSTTSKGWRLEKVVGMPGSGGEVIVEGELEVARPQVAGRHGG